MYSTPERHGVPRWNRYTLAYPALAFGGIMLAMLLLSRAQFNWSDWQPATCMPGACFCESIRGGAIRQPANSWSSLAFVLVSFWSLGVSYADRETRQRAVYAVVFAASLFVVGMGSAFYHASLTFAGQFIDVLGMYLIGTFVLVRNVGRLRVLSDAAAIGVYVSLNVTLAMALYFVPVSRRYLFAAAIVAALFVEWRVRRRALHSRRHALGSVSDGRFLVAAVSVLVVAFLLWILDITKAACAPGSVLQGHAVWHVLGAIACACVFLFYRSERRLGDQPIQD